MIIELKPCPFCGGDAESDSNRAFRSIEGELGRAVAIYCTRCNADMTMCCDDFQEYDPPDLLVILADAWNIRTTSDCVAKTDNTQCRGCIHWRQVIFHALDKKGAAVICFWPTQLPGQIVWLLRARGFDARHEDGFIKGKLDNNDWQFEIA